MPSKRHSPPTRLEDMPPPVQGVHLDLFLAKARVACPGSSCLLGTVNSGASALVTEALGRARSNQSI